MRYLEGKVAQVTGASHGDFGDALSIFIFE
jgi:hypothetical protein